MGSFRSVVAALAVATIAMTGAASRAEADDGGGACNVVDVSFTPSDNLQIVVWVEDGAGNYVDTIFITQQTGTYGIGNRPGILEFNSGPKWPYGRRETTFPVWAHRHGMTFPQVQFQDDDDTNLSHPSTESSHEAHFCRPIEPTEPMWDSGTCASMVFTDKGVLSATATSLYPPRIDVTRDPSVDAPSVDMYKSLDPFDAVSQATPPGGQATTIAWPTPTSLPDGDYVMWAEVSQEFDDNATYNATSYPAPDHIPYATYGEPYRGQPSIVYSVPFTVGGMSEASTSTMAYAGYGDPDGQDGMIRPPDATITTDTPASGASRLQLVSDPNGMYRLLVQSKSENDLTPPNAPEDPQLVSSDTQSATVSFVAPGDDGDTGTVAGYDIRLRAITPITDDNFDSSMPVSASVVPDVAGETQMFDLTGLLPSTQYYVGIRAYDDCRNTSSITVIPFVTPDRQAGEVDACFVATAAYGSLLANDVEVLRSFRDRALRSTVLGELAVETYYTFGPEVAGVVGSSELLRASAREVLAPIVTRVRSFLGR